MSELFEEALDELRQLTRELQERAEESHYGFFIGGDPRDFSPDPECSTEQERAAHKAACDEWNAGNRIEAPMPQCLRGNPAVVGFGLGVTTLDDPVAADAAERLARILDRLERA